MTIDIPLSIVSMTLELSWFSSFKALGVSFERLDLKRQSHLSTQLVSGLSSSVTYRSTLKQASATVTM